MSENNTLSIDSFEQLEADITGCRSCSRLVEWRELVAEEKRAVSQRGLLGKAGPRVW